MHFTATCYLNRIDDLALPLAGHAGADFSKPPNDNYWIRDAQTARAVLADKLPDPQFSAVKLLGWEGSKTLDRIASILIIVSSMLIAYLLVLALRNNGIVFRLFFIGAGVYALLFLALLATSPPVYKINAVWKDYIAGRIESSEASASGMPKEMCAYVESMRHIRHDQFEKARDCLQQVNTNQSPSLRLEYLLPEEKDIASE